MPVGYQNPLYILPFDHRNSYVSSMFHYTYPLDADQQHLVEDSKDVIYEGFLRGVEQGVSREAAAILVDQEFGSSILRDANAQGFVTALSVEKSGSNEFQFEYGDGFAGHIESYNPTFAKVLVRYNPDDDAEMNRRQRERLRLLSDYCLKTNRALMFELLVPATDAQLQGVLNDKDAYDLKLRPQLMLDAIGALQDSGIEASVWKIEGLDRREDCQRVVELARRDGRDEVGCIVLGRGADERKVISWLQTAAAVDGFIGFAVGRTSFYDAVEDYEARKASREQAVQRIADRYAGWATAFESAQKQSKSEAVKTGALKSGASQ
jgi:myo-inositol catabolism protein IolC